VLKKSIFLAIALLMVCSIITPPVHAQSSIHDLTRQQQEEIVKIQEDLLADKISYAEYLKLVTEIVNRPKVTYDPAKLIPPSGKAWVIQDNQVQGSGKAIVFKASGGFEVYLRRLGVWSPSLDDLYKTSATYTATGHTINIPFVENANNLFSGDYKYSFDDNSSTLTITDEGKSGATAAGTYTLRDLPRVQPPGGNIVNPAGTAWQDNWRGTSHDIYHTDGIKYSFGGSGASVWGFELDIWNTYTANPSTGIVAELYHDSRTLNPGEFNYSVTDFGSGNKTLRHWKVWNDNSGTVVDEVYKLVPTPSGFRLPKVR